MDRDDRIDELLDRSEQLRAAGEDISPEQTLPRVPGATG